MRNYPGEDPMVQYLPPVRQDLEEELPDPEDEAAEHKYPPPKKNSIFRSKWMQFIGHIVDRKNFHIAHLNALEVLCDLYVEYDELQKFIRRHGRSYKQVGRQGLMWKFYPEVGQMGRVQKQISDYQKMLGLVFRGEVTAGAATGGEKEQWE